MLAVLASGSRADGLPTLTLPTLVLHGDADPLVDVVGRPAHRRAGPRRRVLRILEGMGHDLPPAYCGRRTSDIIDGVVDRASIARPEPDAERLTAARHRDGASTVGPLAGLKIIEVAGIGPGPFARHDAGGHGRGRDPRRPRPATSSGGDPAAPPADILNRGRRSIGARPEVARGRGHAARPGRAGRRADRGLPARRDRAPRASGPTCAWRATRGWSSAA